MKETHKTLRHLTGADSDFDSLLDLIGNTHFVLIGEGTHEFYAARAAITRRLITETP
jgi:erythromycin esterase-like protein